ncbi:hypothetical protein EJ03DRAFT_330649 [Teratosphaeria nubilosa]|uniref:Uncharacterized protein n=1 Tax=Teratosphaeria nubilosa TaxID=161662 RepID=A0A6G1L064_9PEZI|nr:hypothetical protein EJ03DRAFT_330649 [Teratosphaeria nubilosa]
MTSNANSSYYPGHDGQMANPYPGYQASMGANGHNAGYQPANQYAGYGSVSYPNSAAAGDLQSMDTRRRAIEALNDFLGDIKRRAINPGTYYDVGHRLGGHNSLPLPSGNGYNTGYSNTQTNSSFGNFSAAGLIDSFNNHSDSIGGVQSAVHGTCGLPLPNARTKNDLQDIDRFLEQLQATVYETSNQAAAAGVQQAGVHAQYTGDYGFGNGQFQSRPSHSPPAYQNGTAATFGGLTAAAVPSTSAMDTPALTPASVSSYSSSGQSPLSSHGRASMGSVGGNAMYPNLPSVTGMSDLGSGYPTTTSAPASGLASGYDGLDGRRYSGGRLQRQAPAKEDTEMPDADDGSHTPKQNDGKRPKSKGNSSIDPALRGEDASDTTASTPAAKSEADDKRQEEWIENIRTIESLRKWIGERLSRGDYEQEGQGQAKEGASNRDDDAAASIAKLVEAKIAALPSAAASTPSLSPVTSEGSGAEVKYPSLPTAA